MLQKDKIVEKYLNKLQIANSVFDIHRILVANRLKNNAKNYGKLLYY